jgi:hypothetical protein
MTMLKIILTVMLIPLLASLTLESAGASKRGKTRWNANVSASEQYRNANAYAGYFPPERSYLSNLDEGTMMSGVAGR